MQMHSTDGGINWVPVPTLFAGAYHLAYVDFGDGNTMFVAAGKSSDPDIHLLTSTDPLVGWDVVPVSSLPDWDPLQTGAFNIVALDACQSCADGGAPMIVAIAQENDGMAARSYKSLDGVTWTVDILLTPGSYESVNNNESDSPLGYVDLVAANHGGSHGFLLLSNSLTGSNITVGEVDNTNAINWTSRETGDWYRWESDYVTVLSTDSPPGPPRDTTTYYAAKYNVIDTANRRFIQREYRAQRDLSNCSEEHHVLPFAIYNYYAPALTFNPEYINKWRLTYDYLVELQEQPGPDIILGEDYLVDLEGNIIIIKDNSCVNSGGSECSLRVVFFVDDVNKVAEFEEISSRTSDTGTSKRYKNTSSLVIEHFEEAGRELTVQLKEGVLEDFAGYCYELEQVTEAQHIYPRSYEYVNGVTPPTLDGFLPDPNLEPGTYDVTSVKITYGFIAFEQNANTIGAATLDEASGRLVLGEAYYCDDGNSVNETDCGNAGASWIAVTGDGSHGPIEITYSFERWTRNTTNYLNCPEGHWKSAGTNVASEGKLLTTPDPYGEVI